MTRICVNHGLRTRIQCVRMAALRVPPTSDSDSEQPSRTTARPAAAAQAPPPPEAYFFFGGRVRVKSIALASQASTVASSATTSAGMTT
jgi:hypothetical protein